MTIIGSESVVRNGGKLDLETGLVQPIKKKLNNKHKCPNVTLISLPLKNNVKTNELYLAGHEKTSFSLIQYHQLYCRRVINEIVWHLVG
ncbi:hypothetical protein XBO1_1100028 [Xenorhabdus bovienii str. oregonense]|uniref:Uncharacterized protein n=1 Tax=Xenorhabdus bovienii str. oregonense TaxID=1398202 RepID=A0A077P0J7_XENBV|nr:hypothetical protein XBO1_1100028 [Xenorhabdus bovienii str. oregonense]